MRIKQCKMLNVDQEKRFKFFLKKYSLSSYYNPKKPAVFYSLWSFRFVKEHKSFGLVIWRGTDVIKLEKGLKRIRNMKNIYHVAISSFIANDLKKYGIKYKFIPIVGVNLKYYKPCPLGNEIYTYIPNSNPKKYYERYGMHLVRKIQKKVKYKINIIQSPTQYSRDDLINIYKKCFCSLRMTKHDGLPSQVIEMGLMGRRSFYNGNIPGSIKWDNNIDEIIENIQKEAFKIGTVDYKYSKQVSDFVDVGEGWLDTNFWI